MKKEELYEAMNEIDETMLREAMSFPKKKKAARTKWLAAAACLCVAVVAAIGIFLYRADSPHHLDLLTKFPLNSANTTLLICQLEIDGKTVKYQQVSDNAVILRRLLGELYQQDESCEWYYPADMDSLMYLIRKSSNEDITLWKFNSFSLNEGTTLTYGDLYRFFGVDSAADIVKITTSPSKANNTDFGQSIQKEVGTRTYTDADDIRLFYNSTVNVTFCSETDWREVYDPGDRFTYSFSTDATDKLTSGESTYATRVITLTLADGTEIDSMRYDALGGHFYEYGGVHTIPLDEETVDAMNELFGIQ